MPKDNNSKDEGRETEEEVTESSLSDGNSTHKETTAPEVTPKKAAYASKLSLSDNQNDMESEEIKLIDSINWARTPTDEVEIEMEDNNNDSWIVVQNNGSKKQSL